MGAWVEFPWPRMMPIKMLLKLCYRKKGSLKRRWRELENELVCFSQPQLNDFAMLVKKTFYFLSNMYHQSERARIPIQGQTDIY